ncbi:MAG: oxidoreductase [Gammaproteobacteria bacterium]
MQAHPDIRVGLIGYGFSGATFQAPLIRTVKGLRLTRVCSSKPDVVQRDFPGMAVLSEPTLLIADTEVDLVVIATTNTTHYPLAREALLAGKHVVVEKPFTVTVQEAAELADLAEQKKLVLSVFHNRRWDNDFLTVRHAIESGMLGSIVYFESHFDRYRPLVRQRWREQDLPGSGMLYDLGAHLIDQALVLFGQPDSVQCDLGIQRQGGLADDYFHLTLRYGARRVILHSTMLAHQPGPRFLVHGELGTFTKYGLDPQEAQLLAGGGPGMPGWGVEPVERHGTLGFEKNGLTVTGTVASLAGRYETFYEEMVAAITQGKRAPVSAREGLAVIRVIDLALRSFKEQRVVGFE